MKRELESSGFETTNANLAACLFMCGVPFQQDGQGNIFPVMNIYDGPMLKKLGAEPGKPLFAAAKDMFAQGKGKPGRVHFQFRATDTLREIVKAWQGLESAVAQHKLNSNNSDEPHIQAIATVNATPAEVAIICAQANVGKRMIQSLWKTHTPWVMWGASHDEKGAKEGQTIRQGHFKMCPLDASEATKKHLGVK